MTPRLSIVIVSWNTRAALARCLNSLRDDPEGAAAEVWVVDNGSADGSAEMVRRRFPGVRLLVNASNRGFAAACNQALAQATGRVVALVNSDAVPEAPALRRLCDVVEGRAGVGIVGGQLLDESGRPRRSYGALPSVGAFVTEMFGVGNLPGLRRLLPAVASPPRRRERPREVGYVSGAFLGFRRELLDTIGLLDERYFLYFEEADFCLRAREAGLRVWFEPTIRIRHQGRASAGQVAREAEIHYARSAYAFIAKHRGPAAARRLGTAFGVWLAAHAVLHRAQALARRPGAREALARKQRLRSLHRALGSDASWGWEA